METWERDQIRSHLPELMQMTICDDKFLSILVSRSVISQTDIEYLVDIERSKGRLAQVYQFYRIIQTRSDSYDELIEALRETKQTGAAMLLSEGTKTLSYEGSPPSSSQQISPSPVTSSYRLETIAFDEPAVESSDDRLKLVTAIISNSPFLRKAWKEFAKEIGVSNETVEVLKWELENGRTHIVNIMPLIFDLWIVKAKSNGTTVNTRLLINAVEKVCGDYVTGDHLRLQFNYPFKGAESENICWGDLSPAFQARVKATVGLMLANSKELNEKKSPNYDDILREKYGTTWRALFSNIKGNVLADLSMGKTPNLKFKDTIPKRAIRDFDISIYPNNVISYSELFPCHCTDIFIFTGIERQHLSRLAKRRTTTTTEQLEGISARFLILDKHDHYEKICAITVEPVHLLNFRIDRFHWVTSRGKIDVMRKCRERTWSGIPLEDFLKNMADHSTSRICLFEDNDHDASFPILLHIGKELATMFPERVIIFEAIHIIINELNSMQGTIMKSELEAVLLNLVCENDFERIVLRDKLCSDNVTVELLVESANMYEFHYDEIILDFFKSIRTSFKSIRLWITSTVDSAEVLEKAMCVLSYRVAVTGERVVEATSRMVLKSYREGTTNEMDLFRQVIAINLPELIKVTRCNILFLAILQSKGILGDADIDELSLRKSEEDKNMLFYEIIRTRANAYPALVEALQKTRQSGAIQIFDLRNPKLMTSRESQEATSRVQLKSYGEGTTNEMHLFRQIIDRNLPELIKVTRCSTSFLAILYGNGILGDDDIAQLPSRKSEKEKSMLFYEIISTRVNAYPALVEALQRTGQSGAAAIFQENMHSNAKTNLGLTENYIQDALTFAASNAGGAPQEESEVEIGEIVIGSGKFSVAKIFRALTDSQYINVMFSKWKDIARGLGSSEIEMEKLQRHHMLGKFSATDVIHQIIENWVCREGSSATMQKLIKVFQDNQLEGCVEVLRNMGKDTN